MTEPCNSNFRPKKTTHLPEREVLSTKSQTKSGFGVTISRTLTSQSLNSSLNMSSNNQIMRRGTVCVASLSDFYKSLKGLMTMVYHPWSTSFKGLYDNISVSGIKKQFSRIVSGYLIVRLTLCLLILMCLSRVSYLLGVSMFVLSSCCLLLCTPVVKRLMMAFPRLTLRSSWYSCAKICSHRWTRPFIFLITTCEAKFANVFCGGKVWRASSSHYNPCSAAPQTRSQTDHALSSNRCM